MIGSSPEAEGPGGSIGAIACWGGQGYRRRLGEPFFYIAVKPSASLYAVPDLFAVPLKTSLRAQRGA